MIAAMVGKKTTSEPQFRPKKHSAAKLLSGEAALPTDDRTFEARKLTEIAELLWLPQSLPESERNARLLRALELYEGLEPQGAAEGMLAAQMVGTHAAALDCLRRAAFPGQSDWGRDSNLKHAQKLMALYAQQMAALDKHRGRGQQKVTVEHVHVHSGGQAIVGNVEKGGERQAQPSGPPALLDALETPLVQQKTRKPSKSRRRS
ncbi:hypothetical protein CLV79_1155 [Limimaricola soesokkakensis]|uniref:Uncharacterized protein n=1 Tax=Limimaricola soesokkakensis TaxID=1343159 RepID=A0A1X7A0T8_9RHOB|nr:hypothetical protein [Limimaricola soesokkakensis]PSK81537.1 hypothetical protein CLV79_1155 [Limimaricola soesokkakensis]SLN67028.1 hypothetical protein LOS8367_03328 [Limimaricola soesokkakensis]